MAWHHGLSRAVLRVYTRVLLDVYARGARARGIEGGQTGMVTALQRAGRGSEREPTLSHPRAGRGVHRKGHQVLAPAALAPKPRHAVFEHAARQEFAELSLDELRQARALAGRRHHLQEGLQLLGAGFLTGADA